MRHKPTNKDIERWYLQRFSEAYGAFPHGTVVPGERPDFCIQGGVSLGIEVTRLFREVPESERPLQEIEALRERITTQAQESFDASTGLPIDVAVHFSVHRQLSKQDIKPLAERLVALVQANIPQPGQCLTVEYDWFNRDLVPEEMPLVRIARFPQRDWCLWQPTAAGSVPEIEPHHLQNAIDRKLEGIEAYRNACQELWLLIVADGFGISSTFTFGAAASQCTYSSPFDKTLYFENFSRRAFELIAQTPQLDIIGA